MSGCAQAAYPPLRTKFTFGALSAEAGLVGVRKDKRKRGSALHSRNVGCSLASSHDLLSDMAVMKIFTRSLSHLGWFSNSDGFLNPGTLND